MKIQELITIILQFAPYLFGASGLLAFFQERKKRKIDLKKQQSGALIEMQNAYERFVLQSMEVIERLENEVKELKDKIDEQKREFRAYKRECSGKCKAV